MADERVRWEPDEQLIPSVLAGSGRKMCDLGASDRSWVVAGLTLIGLTAEDIADRMGCSLRLVRSIRAEDMTRVCGRMQAESQNFGDELRLLASTVKSQSATIVELRSELSRVRGKLSRVLDAHVGVRRCGKCESVMSGYNLYVHNGKEFCRSCHRDRQQRYRDSQGFVEVLPGVVAVRVTMQSG